MEQALTVLKNQLGRGGALCKEFNKSRLMDDQNWRVEMHYALQAIENSKQLQGCTAESVGRSLIDLGVMGLTLSPAMRQAYLIPYKDNCTVSPSYMGLEQMAYRTGFIEMIQCGLHRRGDKFKVWTDDSGRHIMHAEGQERHEVLHAYCIADFSSNKRHVEVMDKNDLMACREAAARQNNGEVPFTWKGKFRGEMYKKAVLRRAWKHWPNIQNPRLLAMLDAVNRTDPVEFQNKREDSVVNDLSTIDQSQIDVLVRMMEDAGYPVRGWDAQLEGLALSAGFPAGIKHVLKERFEAVASLMEEGLSRWKSQKSATSPPSTSEPEGSTAREVAA
jgi:phage RecT family recombinase